MRKVLQALLNWRMLIVFAMGFSSGLPLLLIGSTLKAWFTDSGMDLTTIGFFSLIGLPYTLKFLWSPLLDRYVPPFLGRRRGWLIITQVGLVLGFLGLSGVNPAVSTSLVAGAALIVAFFSATQDIALDAYRREILETEEFGLGNSLAITGYRMGMLFGGAFALLLADHFAWSTVYQIMAGGMVVGLLTTVLSPEPNVEQAPPRSLREAFTAPFLDFVSKPGAYWILAFILLYKVGDLMAAEMTMPFYLKTGFSKTEVAAVVKVFGIWSTIAGGLIGGSVILRIGLLSSLWVFGILQSLSTLAFAGLAAMGANLPALTVVITFENLAAGMGMSAFAAFMAGLTNKKFSATQYALLSSLMGVPRVLIAAPTGWMAEIMGWQGFFTFCALAAIPGMLLLFKVGRWAKPDLEEPTPKTANAKVS